MIVLCNVLRTNLPDLSHYFLMTRYDKVFAIGCTLDLTLLNVEQIIIKQSVPLPGQ